MYRGYLLSCLHNPGLNQSVLISPSRHSNQLRIIRAHLQCCCACHPCLQYHHVLCLLVRLSLQYALCHRISPCHRRSAVSACYQSAVCRTLRYGNMPGRHLLVRDENHVIACQNQGIYIILVLLFTIGYQILLTEVFVPLIGHLSDTHDVTPYNDEIFNRARLTERDVARSLAKDE